ncbi:MAG: hypothetical protein B6D37_12570 [Sphingobacteriales bacterium UTBCD1]|nr:MAG: hypothetical protein B6D37_12570 [Sphingobacteriales bacterium UTBCD1]
MISKTQLQLFINRLNKRAINFCKRSDFKYLQIRALNYISLLKKIQFRPQISALIPYLCVPELFQEKAET